MSHESGPDRIHVGRDGLNESRLTKVSVASLGFLSRDLRDNSFIHPTHPPIIFISGFISLPNFAFI